MRNTELNKEILDILDNVIYWETCPKDYKVRIKAIKKQLTLTDVVRSKTLESKIANKRERIKGDLQNAKNIINGNKGMSSDYIIDKTRNMPFLRCKLNLIDELLEN